MHFLNAGLERYITENSEEEPELLAALNRETHLKVLRPRMLSGHIQGRFLSLISKIVRPETLLDVGTYTGYSALCLAEGLSDSGTLHTIDCNFELFDIQQRYFKRSPYGSQIVQHNGNALELIPQIDAVFDLVYIDAEKREYIGYLDCILPKTRPGSVILSDNVLWSGKVSQAPEPGDEATAVLREYNRRLKEDPRLESVILPIRDGLTLTRVV